MSDLSARSAARVAGAGLLVMAALAILGVVGTQNLIVAKDAARTASNLADHEVMFRAGICAWLIVAILDVVVALTLFVVLRPVDRFLSLLAAWFRLVYAAVLVAAISNLLLASQFLGRAAYLPTQLDAQLMLTLDAFRNGWIAGLVLFGVHLGLVGYLVYRSRYIPKILGILLLMASVGYLVANLGKVVVPAYGKTLDAIVAGPAAVGELAFAIWLLVRAARLTGIDESTKS